MEKSLRYPGHIEKMNLLRTLGFFDEKTVEVEGVKVPPRDITEKLLERKLKKPETPDIVAMLITVTGFKGARKVQFTYRLLDRYDRKRKVTAMARTTAYTASVVAQLITKNALEEKGVIPPEKLGMNSKSYSKFMRMMKQRGVRVKESTKAIR